MDDYSSYQEHRDPFKLPQVRTCRKTGWTSRMLFIAALHMDLRVSTSLPAFSPACLLSLMAVHGSALTPALLPTLPMLMGASGPIQWTAAWFTSVQ
jgi:hypothetical protein